MKQFEGNINGKTYTDEKEFNRALFELENTDDMYVSYRYVTVPDTNKNDKQDSGIAIGYVNNYVPESQYVKNITNEKDVELNVELANKLKCASNKLDINETISSKIISFDNKISDNLLHINELKAYYNKLEEKIKSIDGQIKTLECANNNYYLNKEYYTNIKNLLETTTEVTTNENGCNCEYDCECGGDCKCGKYNKCENKKDDLTSLEDLLDIENYLNKNNIKTLSDLVDFFIEKY